MAISAVVTKEPRRTIVDRHQEVKIAIVVDVAVRRAARDDGPREIRAQLAGDILEPAFAKITKENAGGNTPNGEANGIPSKNPAGKCPPGQNTDQSLRKCQR